QLLDLLVVERDDLFEAFAVVERDAQAAGQRFCVTSVFGVGNRCDAEVTDAHRWRIRRGLGRRADSSQRHHSKQNDELLWLFEHRLMSRGRWSVVSGQWSLVISGHAAANDE